MYKETSFKVKGEPSDASDETGITSLGGEMEEIDELSDLADRKTFKLYGLRQNPNAPVVFKVTSTSVEEVAGAAGESNDGEATGQEQMVSTKVTVWQGAEVGKRDRTLSLAVSEDGTIMGTATDGEITYVIQSEVNNDRAAGGKKNLKFVAFDFNDLPEETHSEDFIIGGPEDGGRRALSHGNVRGGSERTLATTTIRIRTIFTTLTYDRLGDGGCANYHALAVNQMNTILVNSYSSVRFESAGWTTTGFADYNGRPAGSYLLSLKKNDDYWMDWAVNGMQPNEDIDVLVVVGEYVVSGQASNVGWRLFGPGPYKYGYAEVNRYLGTLNGKWTYAHELGHIIGGCHDIDSGCDRDNHGEVYDSFCDTSIMAYPRCPSSCSSCPRYPEFTADRWYDNGYDNALYMDNFAWWIAGLY